ncbi:ankyrin repeat domain-containing protein [Xanthomonas arboricola]|uniref:ankyrin repeat domain-containing protein n=1 Tax=Xanthomonas arboricola TaxID=56448 RepID=UPI00118D50B9|nr:ankyrin repeat domain-containing protein [Xanthomonas arboricola]QDS16112.1 ankyrin repeat domain-containing protein [Xanthomonas arboricola]
MATEELLESIRAGNPAEVEVALAKGPALNAQDEHGWTALCWAAGGGNAEIVRTLLARGADIGLCGQDQRTPYLIALAAGHRDAAQLVAQAQQHLCSGASQPADGAEHQRPYCRAYPLAALQQFAQWPHHRERAPMPAQDTDAIVFLHRDFSVTGSIWAGESVIFDEVSDEWRAFCRQQLAFSPPTDLDLLDPAQDG